VRLLIKLKKTGKTAKFLCESKMSNFIAAAIGHGWRKGIEEVGNGFKLDC
jgi:hypothetical protein